MKFALNRISSRSYRWLAVACLTVANLPLRLHADARIADSAIIADAAERQDRDALNQLLKPDANVNATQPDGTSPLHWAAYHNNSSLVQTLINLGAEADLENQFHSTPLTLACENGNPEIVNALVAAGADVNFRLPSGATPLMLASRNGRPAPVQILLDAGADPTAKDSHSQTALMWAAAEGNADAVQVLLDHGDDPNKSLDSGFNPLFFAVREGHSTVAKVLLAAGMDINATMQPKRTGGKNPRKGMSPLLLAVENGHFDLATLLLEAGADPNDQRSGFTPLHTITWVRKAHSGDNADGDPEPQGSGTMTSLEFVRVLCKSGADVNRRLEQGRGGRGKLNHRDATPFLFAARRNDVPLMQLLLELGADPHLSNADNCSPLLTAAGIGTLAPSEEAGTEAEALESVKLLLKLGADINHVDDNGETAMHGAAYKSLPKVVAFLAGNGADVTIWNQKNKYGWTPTLLAEGHRPGNFKPAAETLAAIHQALRDAGVTPPPLTPREQRLGYDQ